jgi:hypothetical protein
LFVACVFVAVATATATATAEPSTNVDMAEQIHTGRREGDLVQYAPQKGS